MSISETNISPNSTRDQSCFSRLEGILSADITNKTIGIIGCGSVGSYIACQLARSGVSHFFLVDPDTVEHANLSRTVYEYGDVGKPKVDALHDKLLAIFPDISVRTFQGELQGMRKDISSVFKDLDIIIGATDDPRAQGIVNRYSYSLGISSLFIGLYRGAKGGEVIAILPETTPCYSCATGGVRDLLGDLDISRNIEREANYGTGKLVREVALGADIHFVCNAAVKMILSLLTYNSGSLRLGEFMKSAIESGQHYVMFGMEPDYYLFPTTHADAQGQYAYQTVWLSTTRRNDCSICGSEEFREPI